MAKHGAAGRGWARQGRANLMLTEHSFQGTISRNNDRAGATNTTRGSDNPEETGARLPIAYHTRSPWTNFGAGAFCFTEGAMGSYLGLEDPRFKGVRNKWPIFKQVMYERANGICGICGKPVPFDDIQLDHIVPAKHGGRNHYTNMQIAHSSCNLKKSDELPEGASPGNDMWLIYVRRRRAREQAEAKKYRASSDIYDQELWDMIESETYSFEAQQAALDRHLKRIGKR
jgi:hypothetical protein